MFGTAIRRLQQAHDRLESQRQASLGNEIKLVIKVSRITKLISQGLIPSFRSPSSPPKKLN